MDHPLPVPEIPDRAPPADSPCRILAATAPAIPLVLASPHSGRDYTAAFLAAARLDPRRLRRSEDCFVDELFAAGPALGAPLLAATFPRAFCDPNREAWELDPAMFADPLPPWVNTTSPRVCAGLGTIARVVSSGEAIYRRKLSFSEAEDRVRCCWQPYHAALAALIGQARAVSGACLLLDCHSMPAGGAAGRAAAEPDFVLGDAHGTACAPRITRLLEAAIAGMGYVVRRNDPYAGGYVTRHYGRPREGVHVVQVEIARGLYMQESRIEKLPRFDLVQRDITRLLATLATALPGLLAG